MNTLFFVVCIVAIVVAGDTLQKYMKLKQSKQPDNEEIDRTLAEIERLEERIRVLEKIVTENKYDLKREIDAL
jgi:cell division protein FtsB